MTEVLQAFLGVVPPTAKRSGSGWLNFDCPACGDTRKRCGFFETPTGGFRIRCFNAQCPYNDASTGWEPGGGLGGRPRKIFQLLGGDLRDIPIDIVIRTADRYAKSGKITVDAGEAPVLRFDDSALPQGAIPFSQAVDSSWSDKEVMGLTSCCEYVASLNGCVSESEFMWSPKTPSFIIVPFVHWGKTVGWQSRDCGPTRRFYSKCPADYIFRQDTVERRSGRVVIVTEGVVTALALESLATRNSNVTKKQEAFLRNLGRRVIMIPDQESSGAAFVDCAERNGWEVSIPDWDPGVKNGCDAAARYGTLYAVASIVSGATRNYIRARVALKMRGS